MSGFGTGTARDWDAAVDVDPTSAVDEVVDEDGDLAPEMAEVDLALLAPEDLAGQSDAGGWNLLAGSSFETDAGWSVQGGWQVPFQTPLAFHGAAAARLTALPGGQSGELVSDAFPVAISGYYWVSYWSRVESWTAGAGQCVLREFDATGALLLEREVGLDAGPTAGWERRSLRVGPRSSFQGDATWHIDAVEARVAFRAQGQDASLDWYVDGAQAGRGEILTAYAPNPHENIPGGSLVPGSVPAAAFDQTPPQVPQGLALSSATVLDADGKGVTRLTATIDEPTDSDYIGSDLQATGEYQQSDPGDPATATPDWSHALPAWLPKGEPGVEWRVAAATRHWGRARSVDATGNASEWCVEVEHRTVGDMDAPPIPNDAVATPGFRLVALAWSPSAIADLAAYEVRWRPTGTADDWSVGRARSNFIVVQALDPALSWDFQVRAVDLSGNVATSLSDSLAVDALENPEAGWSAVVAETPLQIGTTDIAAGAVTADHILAGSMDAAIIGTGLLILNTVPGNGVPDGIRVVASDLTTELGSWDERGLYVRDPASPALRFLRIRSGAVEITTTGGSESAGGYYDTAITPDGINASRVTFGEARGGHNLIANSSFELNGFGAAATAAAFDGSGSTPPWAAAQRTGLAALVNMTEGAASLSMTAATY